MCIICLPICELVCKRYTAQPKSNISVEAKYWQYSFSMRNDFFWLSVLPPIMEKGDNIASVLYKYLCLESLFLFKYFASMFLAIFRRSNYQRISTECHQFRYYLLSSFVILSYMPQPTFLQSTMQFNVQLTVCGLVLLKQVK